MRRLVSIYVILLAMAACQSPATEDLLATPDALDGPARVIDAELGDSVLGIEVVSVPPGIESPSDEDIAAASVVIRFPVSPGESVAAIVRAESASVDPYGLLRDGEGTMSVSGGAQAVWPGATEDDVVLTATARQAGEMYLFVTGGEYMHTSGRLRVDLLSVSEPVAFDTSITSGAVRVYHGELRETTDQVAAMVAEGWLEEGADGFLAEDPEADIPLRDRAEARRLASSVNEVRELLFEELAVTHGTSTAAVSASLASLWQAVASL